VLVGDTHKSPLAPCPPHFWCARPLHSLAPETPRPLRLADVSTGHIAYPRTASHLVFGRIGLGNLDPTCTLRAWLESSLTAETVCSFEGLMTTSRHTSAHELKSGDLFSPLSPHRSDP
jgi:hypothetical protein